LANDYAIYSPSGYPEPTSREKLIENYKAAAQAFKSFTWKTEEFIAAGDKVKCRIMVSGIYQGSVPDLSAKGNPFTFSLITIIRIKNGKIAEECQEDDQLGFVRQLGMELRPKGD
jgi:predicted ester cyclase